MEGEKGRKEHEIKREKQIRIKRGEWKEQVPEMVQKKDRRKKGEESGKFCTNLYFLFFFFFFLLV